MCTVRLFVVTGPQPGRGQTGNYLLDIFKNMLVVTTSYNHFTPHPENISWLRPWVVVCDNEADSNASVRSNHDFYNFRHDCQFSKVSEILWACFCCWLRAATDQERTVEKLAAVQRSFNYWNLKAVESLTCDGLVLMSVLRLGTVTAEHRFSAKKKISAQVFVWWVGCKLSKVFLRKWKACVGNRVAIAYCNIAIFCDSASFFFDFCSPANCAVRNSRLRWRPDKEILVIYGSKLHIGATLNVCFVIDSIWIRADDAYLAGEIYTLIRW